MAGNPAISYTETHQVIVHVGYAKGIEAAKRLEENNIIVNFQAKPDEEGFTASGGLRLGVSEMTRFGSGDSEFRKLAGLIRDVVLDGKKVRDEVTSLRRDYQDLKFRFFRGTVCRPDRSAPSTYLIARCGPADLGNNLTSSTYPALSLRATLH